MLNSTNPMTYRLFLDCMVMNLSSRLFPARIPVPSLMFQHAGQLPDSLLTLPRS